LKAVQQKPLPLLVVDADRAARVYPVSHLAEKWTEAVRWMQQRPGGSIWILDTNRPAPKWRAHPQEQDA
jgi:hypothetical protein